MSDDKTYTVLAKDGREISIKWQDLMQHLKDQTEEDLWQQAARQSLSDAHLIEYEIASLAKMEIERRVSQKATILVIITTVFSAIMGIIGVVVGYYLRGD
jgi:hypothetical protein